MRASPSKSDGLNWPAVLTTVLITAAITAIGVFVAGLFPEVPGRFIRMYNTVAPWVAVVFIVAILISVWGMMLLHRTSGKSGSV